MTVRRRKDEGVGRVTPRARVTKTCDRDTRAACVDRSNDTSAPADAQPTLAESAQPLPPGLREALVDVLARRLLARLRAEGFIDGADAHDSRDAQRARDADIRGDREVTRT